MGTKVSSECTHEGSAPWLGEWACPRCFVTHRYGPIKGMAVGAATYDFDVSKYHEAHDGIAWPWSSNHLERWGPARCRVCGREGMFYRPADIPGYPKREKRDHVPTI